MYHRPVVAPNGLNLTKARRNPDSLLARVVNYIRDHGPVTKRVLLTEALRLEVDTVKQDKYGFYTYGALRGYHSNMFRIAVAAGYLKHSRVGKLTLWTLGPKARNVVV